MVIWECLPEYMKSIFVRAFGRTGLAEPDKRPSEAEWTDVLVRFCSDIVGCKCGNEAFVKENGDAICDVCGEKLDIPLWIKMPEYKIPCVKDSRIYYLYGLRRIPDRSWNTGGRGFFLERNGRSIDRYGSCSYDPDSAL
jgi:hypothetical protein